MYLICQWSSWFKDNPGGGGYALNKVLYREAPPRGLTPYLYVQKTFFFVQMVPLAFTYLD